MKKVKANYSFSFSGDVRLKVKKGDVVKSGALLAEAKKNAVVQEYNVGQLVGVPPKKVLACLVKKLGEAVIPGELLAQKKSFLGKTEKKFFSPCQGILDSLTEEGVLRIRLEGEKLTISAPFASQVEKASPREISLAFPAWEVKGLWGVGGQRVGPLLVLSKKFCADIFTLAVAVKGKVLAVKGGFTHGFCYKAMSLEVTGLVAGRAKKKIRTELAKENLPFVALAEKQIDDELWQFLQKNEDKMILIEGEEKRLLIPQ